MWQVEEHRRVDRQLSKAPLEILRRYETWKQIARLSGPEGLKRIKGFRDEGLVGEWKGFRSSRLDLKWRVIYEVRATSLVVQVVRASPHDYRSL